MATWFKFVCKCGFEFDQAIGGSFNSIQMVCASCGNVKYVPRKMPLDITEMNAEKMIEFYLSDQKSWPRYGRGLTDLEMNLRQRLFMTCLCGGPYSLESHGNLRFRCPSCKSDEFIDKRPSGLISD